MSKILNNPLLKGVSGKFANVVVYRQIRGKVQMANVPKPRDVVTKKQQDVISKFKRAVAYAKRQMLSPEMEALYKTGVSGSKFSAYMVALTDYLVAPTIHSVDTTTYQGVIGDVIAIRASDDFRLTSLEVTIVDAQGQQLERGAAQLQLDATDDYRYTATVSNPVKVGTKFIVVARDTAGNTTVSETVL